jgi:hypothetical protein
VPPLFRRLAGALIVLALAGGGVIGLLAVLSSRDSSKVSVSSGPGLAQASDGDAHLPTGTPDPTYGSSPPTSGAHVISPVAHDGILLSDDELLTALEQGNVVLLYSDPRQTAALKAIASTIAGAFSATTAAAGQAVILDPQPSGREGPVTALAWRHRLTVSTVKDAGLGAFVSYWLGRGVGASGS